MVNSQFHFAANPHPQPGEHVQRVGHAAVRRVFDRRQPEIRLLESELCSHAFNGIISLHTDDTSHGVYGYAHGAVLTRHLLGPALASASEFLPLNQNGVIDGFDAREGIIRDGPEGVLRAPPGMKPRPFEVILETPHHAPQFLQEAAKMNL